MARTERTRMDDYRPEWLQRLYMRWFRIVWWCENKAADAVSDATGVATVAVLGVLLFACVVLAIAVLTMLVRNP